MATLRVPQVVPTAAEDSEQLRKAFVGLGTNEKLIISVLAHRNASQRRRIREVYHELYGENLIESLGKEISGDFERAVKLWTLEPAERDALLANEAATKSHSGNLVLVELSCARSADELFATRRAYLARYKRSLEEDVAAHTKGDFRKLLVPLITSYRYEGPEVNRTVAKSDAKVLHKAIANKEYNNEEIIMILSTRSKAQLIAAFNHYNDEFCKSINKDLKRDVNDEFLRALRAIIRCIVCPERYLEKVIRRSMEGLGTDENALSRVITTRAEVDLKKIKEVYSKRNSKALEKAISEDASGDYQAFLLALLCD